MLKRLIQILVVVVAFGAGASAYATCGGACGARCQIQGRNIGSCSNSDGGGFERLPAGDRLEKTPNKGTCFLCVLILERQGSLAAQVNEGIKKIKELAPGTSDAEAYEATLRVLSTNRILTVDSYTQTYNR